MGRAGPPQWTGSALMDEGESPFRRRAAGRGVQPRRSEHTAPAGSSYRAVQARRRTGPQAGRRNARSELRSVQRSSSDRAAFSRTRSRSRPTGGISQVREHQGMPLAGGRLEPGRSPERWRRPPRPESPMAGDVASRQLFRFFSRCIQRPARARPVRMSGMSARL